MNVVRETDIAAPAAKVYEYLLDFRRHSQWTTPGHSVKITAASDGPTVVGSVFDSEGHQFGAQRDRLEVTELVPNRKLVYEATMKDGTRLRHTLEMRPVG
ncbi:MAG TPA: SRPBCC family protein, partial [Dehalococcoidia bacterium]|nr:SRPBCC family protein [Dehalococcoidia bacterium]